MEFKCSFCEKRLRVTNTAIVVCTCEEWLRHEAARHEVKPVPARNKKKSDYR